MEQVSEYQQQAIDFANKYGVKLQILDTSYGRHFDDDEDSRYIFKCKLSRGKKSYTFNFGQSLAKEDEQPTIYDVLTCMEKYDVGTFEEFCSNYGYNDRQLSEYPRVKKIYNAVLKEYKAMMRLFPEDGDSDVWQELQEIS